MKVYLVNELVILTDNQFEISSNTHLITTDVEAANDKFEELLIQASKDFNDAPIIVETANNKYVQRADGCDRIEVSIEEMKLS